MCYNFSIEIHKAQLLMASQEQASTVNPPPASTPVAAANLPPPSVSQSNMQPQLQTPASLASSMVANSLQLQHLQKHAAFGQVNGHHPAAAPFPYSYPTLPPGYAYAAPAGLAAAPTYDPKAMLAATNNKLKMLPTPAGIKLDQRYAPY